MSVPVFLGAQPVPGENATTSPTPAQLGDSLTTNVPSTGAVLLEHTSELYGTLPANLVVSLFLDGAQLDFFIESVGPGEQGQARLVCVRVYLPTVQQGVHTFEARFSTSAGELHALKRLLTVTWIAPG